MFYLKNALEIEQSDQNSDKLNIAGTHLNLCAIYSKLNKHQFSIFHAKNAIKLIEKLLRDKNASEFYPNQDFEKSELSTAKTK